MTINIPVYKIIKTQSEAEVEAARLKIFKKQIEEINLLLIERIENLSHFTELPNKPCEIPDHIYSKSVQEILKIKTDIKSVFNL